MDQAHLFFETTLNYLGTPAGRLGFSFFLFFLAVVVNRIMYWSLVRKLGHNGHNSSTRATWVRRRNVVWASTVLLVVALWSNQITGFLLSLAAIGGALLIVSKELILCLWGALVISVNKSLKIGSTIEIAGHTGQLVNTGFFNFDLLEIGQSKKQTGRLLQLPNSLIFTNPLKVLSFYGEYGMHLIDFHLRTDADFALAERTALDLANEVGSSWIVEAEKYFAELEQSQFVDLPKARPEVFFASVDEKCVKMTLRVACPIARRGHLEKAVSSGFWAKLSTMQSPAINAMNQTSAQC